jgi:hypothetical protein
MANPGSGALHDIFSAIGRLISAGNQRFEWVLLTLYSVVLFPVTETLPHTLQGVRRLDLKMSLLLI